MMKLKIGIDGRALLNKTGVGHYVSELCKELDRLFPGAEFYVYNREPLDLPVNNKRWKMRADNRGLGKRIPNFLWFKFVSGIFCRKDCIDVYWGAASFLPFFLGTIPTILTVYDLVYKIAPHTMYTVNLWLTRFFFKSDLLAATKVISISKGTAKRVQAMMNRESDAVVYPSASDRFHSQKKEKIKQSLTKFGITSPYLLSVATWEPRKNLLLLLKTFTAMKAKGELGDCLLVLVGGKGWKHEDLIKFLGTSENLNSILVLGYIDEEDLISIYSGATGFLFPSIYEGFGMPVLEARKCGISVATTDTPELREAGGKTSIYIQPTFDGIRNGILELLNSPNSELKETIPNPSWEEGAQQMARLFSEAASGSTLNP